ncbi:metallophosphoesterase [Clostridium sp.]|uniref:metallophosphoesterase n=1 Tax=Clostridium sp. TaxID=1506 RepID=UPI003F37157B
MLKRNKIIAASLAMAMASSIVLNGLTQEAKAIMKSGSNNDFLGEDESSVETYSLKINEEEYSKPKQVNVHMGESPSSEVNFTYTTITGDLETKVVLNKLGSSEKIVVNGENSIGNANKYFHKIEVKGLDANTTYEYTVGTGEDTFSGKFKTAPSKGSKESFKFAFIADGQVSNATNAKALGATLAEVNKMGLDFVYMAGDTTDTSTNESQWELLFNNEGAFPTGGEDMFSNNLISVVQGNHDNNTLTRHINAPAEEGNVVYSYDYGPATFVMLNLETARYDAEARAKQKEHLINVVNEAKERGQWTLVGFHKSIYTGASHITDSDAIEARNYWGPVFAELDVDVVMQGHDHVYSRGFINEDGYNANPSKDENGNVINPENAPLYMVGGHAGGLKWYSKKNYTVGTGDRLAPGYSFLDVNSTDTGSDVKKEQVIVELEVSEKDLTVNTYMFKYDTNTDTITTDKYLYDSVTVVRDVEENPYEAKLSDVSNVEGKAGVEFKVPVTVNELPTDSIIRSSEIVFDIPDDLEVKNVELNNKVIKASNWDYNVSDGKLRVALANLDDEPIFINNLSGNKNIATLTLSLKEDKKTGDSTVINMSDLVLRCENDVDVEYSTKNAKSIISFVEKEASKVNARELYKSEGIDVIPGGMKAIAAEFTLTPSTTEVKFGNNDFYYSPEFTNKTGKVTYVSLVPEEISLEDLSNIDNYTLTEKDKEAQSVVFGDINNDGIDAQDALASVTAWLRKTTPDKKGMLSINVNADGKINTRDAIDVVDNYVSGKEFNILSK